MGETRAHALLGDITDRLESSAKAKTDEMLDQLESETRIASNQSRRYRLLSSAATVGALLAPNILNDTPEDLTVAGLGGLAVYSGLRAVSSSIKTGLLVSVMSDFGMRVNQITGSHQDFADDNTASRKIKDRSGH